MTNPYHAASQQEADRAGATWPGPGDRNYAQQALDLLEVALPDLDPALAQLYALLVLTYGTQTRLRDVHDAWALWRNTTNPAHRSLVPFDDLSHEVQELDRPYVEAIHGAARALRS